LEPLLEHYLQHEDERRALAAAARQRVEEFSFPCLWQQAVVALKRDWPAVRERSRQRPALAGEAEWRARAWQSWGSSVADPPSPAALAAALVSQPAHADLHNTLGLALTQTGQAGGPLTAPLVQQAAGYFGRAWESNPGHLAAGLNFVEALA